jgi:hypothetical protein
LDPSWIQFQLNSHRCSTRFFSKKNMLISSTPPALFADNSDKAFLMIST